MLICKVWLRFNCIPLKSKAVTNEYIIQQHTSNLIILSFKSESGRNVALILSSSLDTNSKPEVDNLCFVSFLKDPMQKASIWLAWNVKSPVWNRRKDIVINDIDMFF